MAVIEEVLFVLLGSIHLVPLYHHFDIKKKKCSSYSIARFSLPAWRTRQPISTLTLNKNSYFFY